MGRYKAGKMSAFQACSDFFNGPFASPNSIIDEIKPQVIAD